MADMVQYKERSTSPSAADPNTGETYVSAPVVANAKIIEMNGEAPMIAGGTGVEINTSGLAGDKSDGIAVAPDPLGATLSAEPDLSSNTGLNEVQGKLIGQIDASDYKASEEEYIPPVEPPDGMAPMESAADTAPEEMKTLDGALGEPVEAATASLDGVGEEGVVADGSAGMI